MPAAWTHRDDAMLKFFDNSNEIVLFCFSERLQASASLARWPRRQVRGAFFWAPLPYSEAVLSRFARYGGAKPWPSKSVLTPQPGRRKPAGGFFMRQLSKPAERDLPIK
jgi:hypothetical protein